MARKRSAAGPSRPKSNLRFERTRIRLHTLITSHEGAGRRSIEIDGGRKVKRRIRGLTAYNFRVFPGLRVPSPDSVAGGAMRCPIRATVNRSVAVENHRGFVLPWCTACDVRLADPMPESGRELHRALAPGTVLRDRRCAPLRLVGAPATGPHAVARSRG
jgi:hypothetical protein